MHMVFARRTTKRQLFDLLGHSNLVDIGRVAGGDRRQWLGLGGCSRTLLHARGHHSASLDSSQQAMK